MVKTLLIVLEWTSQKCSYLICTRFSVAALLFFSLWGVVACHSKIARPLAANTLLLENGWQLLVLSTTNTLAMIFSLAIFRFLANRHKQRNDDSFATIPWMWWHYSLTGLAAAITPIWAVAYSKHQSAMTHSKSLNFSSVHWALVLIVSGVLIGFFVMLGLGRLRSRLLGSTQNDENFFPFENRLISVRRWDWLQKYATEMQLVVYLIAIILFYYLFGYRYAGETTNQVFSIATYIVMLGWMAVVVLSIMSYLIDNSRFPVLLALGFWIIAVSSINSCRYESELPVVALTTDATSSAKNIMELTTKFEGHKKLSLGIRKETELMMVDATEIKKKIEDEAWAAIGSRLSRLDEISPDSFHRTLVIVTCPGGGIHAAAWTSHVLEQLDRRYEDFSASICVISGVSGGSLGTMIYVNGLRSKDDPKYSLDGQQWEKAAESSLSPIGIGLAFEDVPALVLPWRPNSDRGIRLENNWKARLGKEGNLQTLNHWSGLAKKGDLPIVILNATDAASGRRVLFSTLATPGRASLESRLGRPWDIRELFDCGKFDMHMATAARASATFPYVTPFTKPEKATSLGRRVAIGDGGYADNEGVVTAIDWMDFISRRAAQEKKIGKEVPFDRILLLRITPSSDAESLSGVGTQPASWKSYVRWLGGPLEALVSMRTASQTERGQVEVDLSSTFIETKWWENEPGASTTPNMTDSEGDSKTVTVKKNLSSVRDGQIDIYRKEIIAQQEIMLQNARESRMPETGIELPPAANDNSTEETEDTPLSQAFVIDENAEWIDYPVLIVTLPFMAVEQDELIPLNWRLSDRQKAWYPQAWTKMLNKRIPAEKPELYTSVFFQELDYLFKRRKD